MLRLRAHRHRFRLEIHLREDRERAHVTRTGSNDHRKDKKKKTIHAVGAKHKKWRHGRCYTTMILRWQTHVDATNYSTHYHSPPPGSIACRNSKKKNGRAMNTQSNRLLQVKRQSNSSEMATAAATCRGPANSCSAQRARRRGSPLHRSLPLDQVEATLRR